MIPASLNVPKEMESSAKFMWGELDRMAKEDPKKYREFIAEQMAAAKAYMDEQANAPPPPQPAFCCKMSCAEDGVNYFLNFCGSEAVGEHEPDSKDISMYVCEPVRFQMDVVVHPGVIKKCTEDAMFKSELITLVRQTLSKERSVTLDPGTFTVEPVRPLVMPLPKQQALPPELAAALGGKAAGGSASGSAPVGLAPTGVHAIISDVQRLRNEKAQQKSASPSPAAHMISGLLAADAADPAAAPLPNPSLTSERSAAATGPATTSTSSSVFPSSASSPSSLPASLPVTSRVIDVPSVMVSLRAIDRSLPSDAPLPRSTSQVAEVSLTFSEGVSADDIEVKLAGGKMYLTVEPVGLRAYEVPVKCRLDDMCEPVCRWKKAKRMLMVTVPLL